MTVTEIRRTPAPGRAPAAHRARPVLAVVRAAPFCTGLTVALWVLGAATGSLLTGPGADLRAWIGLGAEALGQGHWWAPLSSALWSSGLSGYVVVTVLLLAVCAPMERRLGTARAVLLFAGSQVAGAGLAMGAVRLGTWAGDVWAGHLASEFAVGASPGGIGLLLAGTAMIDPLWRRRLRVLVMAALVTTTLYAGDLPDVVRLAAGLAGLVAGALLLSRPGLSGSVTSGPAALGPARSGSARSGSSASGPAALGSARSRRSAPRATGAARAGSDRRTLVAVLVAASALGPLSTILAAHRYGPLSALNFLFLPTVDVDQVASWCSGVAAPHRYGCTVSATAFLVQGIGPLFQTLLPVLLLLTLAEGLRRGRRAAYLATVTVNLALALVGALLTRRQMADLISDNRGHVLAGSEFWIVRLAPIVLPLAIAVLVFVYRREFTVRLPWRTHRGWVVMIAVTAVVVTAVYLGVGWAVRDQFRPPPTMHALLASLPARFAPAGYLVVGRSHFFPAGPVAVGLYEWTGAVFWAVVLMATLMHFWRSRRLDLPPDREAAAAILREHGGNSSLAYMTLWRGNHYYFTPNGSTYLAYRVITGVAVTTGGPIGPDRDDALAGFIAHCADAGWTPCFFSVTRVTADALGTRGFRSLQVASDTVIDPQALSFTGKRWQDVRSALNRAKRDDVRARWSAFGDLPRSLADQVVRIDAQWLAGKQLPEMGFTLGGLAELNDPDVRCLLAVDPDARVLAVTSWLPGYRDGHVVGWTLDFMRRGPDAFPGAMEFLIATALTTFRDEGADWVSLSGVPLAWPEGDGPAGGMGRAMDAMSGMLEPVYGFRSLLAFKAKFAPEYRPLLMAYPDPAALPTVTNAVLRAYVPHLGPAQFAHLARRLVRSGPPAPRLHA